MAVMAGATVALLLLVAAAAEGELCEGGHVVTIEGVGAVCGDRVPLPREDEHVHRFLGIPFAEKPDRFQPPTEFAKWDGVLNAIDPAPGCPQIADILSVFMGVDDVPAPAPAPRNGTGASRRGLRQRDPDNCLTLDVYTPDLSPAEPLPVLFFIHGGAFVLGTSAMGAGDFLLEHERLVVVSVQYRLGPDGFMSLDSAAVPGNAALYDQLKALQWTKDHVAAFGGDPRRVVIGGVSAGAASAALLYVSPLAQDLFAGAALFSGSALAPWAVDSQPLRSARGVGALVGCLRPPPDFELCVRRRSPVALQVAWFVWTVYEKYFRSHGMGGVIPSVQGGSWLEGEFPAEAAFPRILPRHPRDLLADPSFKAKPLLVGVNKHEGSFIYPQVDLPYMRLRKATNDPYTVDFALGELLVEFSDIHDPIYVTAEGIKKLYFSEDVIGNYSAMYEGMVDFTGAGFFKGPSQQMARLAAERGGPVYLYQFSHYLDLELPFDIGYIGKVFGPSVVAHGQDQLYLFHQSVYPYSEKDMQMVDLFCHLVATFVRDLVPQVEGVNWQPYSYASDKFLLLKLPPEVQETFSDQFYVMETERAEREDDDEDSTDEPPTGEPSTEEPPTDEPLTEEPPTDEPPTDEPPTDEPPTDEPSTDEPPTDEPPTDEPPTDEPPTDEPPTDEPPTDEPSTEKPPTDEPPTDEPPTDEPPTDEPPTDEPPTDEPPTDETPTDEPPTDKPGDGGASVLSNTPLLLLLLPSLIRLLLA